MTSKEGVFAAGDLASGALLVVRAIQEGLGVAAGLADWLGKKG